MGTDALEGPVNHHGVEADVPGLGGLGGRLGEEVEPAFLSGLAAPVVDQLVSGHPDAPRDGHRRRISPAERVDGGQERLCREILGERPLSATGRQVGVDTGRGIVVEGQKRRPLVGPGWRGFAHMPNSRSAGPSSDASDTICPVGPASAKVWFDSGTRRVHLTCIVGV